MRYVVDVETTKAPNHQPWMKNSALVSVAIADETGRTKTWLFNHKENSHPRPQAEMVAEIQEEINKATLLVGHNIKFDLNWLRHIGVKFNHLTIWCTQITEFLLLGQQMGELHLADLSVRYGIPPKMDQVKIFWDAGWETTDIPLNILIPYGEQDCLNALAISQRQYLRVQEQKMESIVAVQNELTKVLSDIESNGIGWDQEEAQRQADLLQDQLKAHDTVLNQLLGYSYNYSSTYELSAALFGGVIKRPVEKWFTRELKHETKYYPREVDEEIIISGAGFKPVKGSELDKTADVDGKKHHYYSTDKNYLDQLTCRSQKHRDIKETLLKRTKIKKALETLIGKKGDKGLINQVAADGRIHGSYNQTIAVTGRLSSSKPNLQNQPRKKTSSLKLCFISKNGKLVSVDLKQIEWRVCGYLCQDPTMLYEIRTGVDAHRENAINILGANPDDENFDELRNVAKIITFRLIYGGSAYGFYKDQKMPRYTLKRWEEIVKGFWKKYPGLKRWHDRIIAQVNRNNGTLRSVTGRKFVFSKMIKKDRRTGIEFDEFDEKQIKNYPVQSLATADIMPVAMIIIHKAYRKSGLRSLLVAQVHDNLVWDCYEDEIDKIIQLCTYVFEHIPEYMEELFGININVPIGGDAEVGERWATVEKYQIAA